MLHVNVVMLLGRVSSKGPQLRYAETGTPTCSFVLEIDEHTHGKVYTTYIPCEISGKQAERTAIELEAGDVVQISGKWKYKSSVDAKTGAKVSKPLVSSWGIQQREAAHVPQDEPARPDATPETSAATSVAPEPKPRRP